jgi:GMP synthase (glutamine-hydrolysing)
VGFCKVGVLDDTDVLAGLGGQATVYHHHTDAVVEVPLNFRILASSADCAVEAFADPARRWWGTQFHPERYDGLHPDGKRILESFVRLARGA